ncbi:MAG: DUF3515 domain-containing protein [Microbacteriaceae bacterium]|nr:DUF3515 domain-containing protein [Microbacteriaceae bacterium]
MKFSATIARFAALAAAAAALFALTACGAGPVPMKAAEDANNPACANVTVRLPDTVGALKKRSTNAQATGAWGDPAVVLLRCGLPVSAPTTQPCVNVNGIDWIVDESKAPNYRFEAYGRDPGLEVLVDSTKTSGTDALLELGSAISQLPQTRQCSSVKESTELRKAP